MGNETREVVAALDWRCVTCGKAGRVDLDCVPDVMGVMARVKRAHRAVSPKCSQPCPSWTEVDPSTPTREG